MAYKNAFIVSLLIGSFSALQAMELGGQALVPERLGQLTLIHTNNSFYVDRDDDDAPQQIQNCFLDKELRGISSEKLEKFLDVGYVSLSQMSDGQYSLQAHVRGNGGGPGGATAGFYLGKFLTHFVGHGTIFIVACCTGPAFPVTLASLEATFAVPIEAASNVVALGTGIAGAVVTGPV